MILWLLTRLILWTEPRELDDLLIEELWDE